MLKLLIIDKQVHENIITNIQNSKKNDVLLMSYDSMVTKTMEEFKTLLNSFIVDNSIQTSSISSIGWGFHGYPDYENDKNFSLLLNSPKISLSISEALSISFFKSLIKYSLTTFLNKLSISVLI